MPSPFPGMDPYLEDPAFWADFHSTFLICWREAIEDALPGGYDAQIGESVNLIQMSPEVIKLIYPDIAVTKEPGRTRRRSNGGGTMLLEPVTIPHEFVEEVRQTRIEVIHRQDRQLIAVLEMLSPFNKTGDGFKQYKAKRAPILGRNIHLVELDLLVGGDRPPLRYPLPDGDYFVYISRADRRPDCDVFHWTVRQPLPSIPIPLRAPDPDIRIDLGRVFRTTYQRGRYGRKLFYGKTPAAPLKAADAAWARRVSTRK